ncbi:unnamed protein product [Callosobruchus maculatus]|uniref:Uncharacterized protein n=1 Tax=Callosobruchus maculatus TaxID=64391 RepID=A0A653CPT4_CALMS|nr:unnamed protein product [Callosobruchus maculatus]
MDAHERSVYKFFVNFFVFPLQKDGVLLGEKTSPTTKGNGRIFS